MISKEELSALIQTAKWKKLGEGTYNEVQVSEQPLAIGALTCKWVRKIPLSTDDLSDDDVEDSSNVSTLPAINDSERAVRKWNLLNPDYPAYLIDSGWIAPFLGKRAASDTQIASELMKIYRDTRNIVADAPSHNNFLRVNGETVCVDVDNAFRRGSPVSEKYYQKNEGLQSHQDFFDDMEARGFPKTVKVIRSLIYLERYLSQDQIKNDYIQPGILDKLHVFEKNAEIITEQTLDMLLKIIAVDPHNKIEPLFFNAELINQLVELQKQGRRITKKTIIELLTIHPCIRNGRLDLIKSLIEKDRRLVDQVDGEGSPPLHLAASSGNIVIAQYLVAQKANINALNAQLLTAMDIAIANNHMEVALFLFASGASIFSNPEGLNHAIHAFAKQNRYQEIQTLVSRIPSLLNTLNATQQTPLAIAAAGGHNETVQCLIALGADINGTPQHKINVEDNYTALDWAFMSGHETTINILLAAGAISNFLHTKFKGKTLLELIWEGNLTGIQILVRNNRFLLKQVNELGQLPIETARLLGNVTIETLLFMEEAASFPIDQLPSNPLDKLQKDTTNPAPKRIKNDLSGGFFSNPPPKPTSTVLPQWVESDDFLNCNF